MTVFEALILMLTFGSLNRSYPVVSKKEIDRPSDKVCGLYVFNL